METKFLIDTDVLIDYLRGFSMAVKFLKKSLLESGCYISTITVAELYAGVKEGKEKQVLSHFLQEFNVIPMSFLIAEKGGLFRRDFGKSHGVGLADAIIAATAEHLNAELITLNHKHYPMLKEVKIPYQKQ